MWREEFHWVSIQPRELPRHQLWPVSLKSSLASLAPICHPHPYHTHTPHYDPSRKCRRTLNCHLVFYNFISYQIFQSFKKFKEYGKYPCIYHVTWEINHYIIKSDAQDWQPPPPSPTSGLLFSSFWIWPSWIWCLYPCVLAINTLWCVFFMAHGFSEILWNTQNLYCVCLYMCVRTMHDVCVGFR